MLHEPKVVCRSLRPTNITFGPYDINNYFRFWWLVKFVGKSKSRSTKPERKSRDERPLDKFVYPENWYEFNSRHLTLDALKNKGWKPNPSSDRRNCYEYRTIFKIIFLLINWCNFAATKGTRISRFLPCQ